MAYYESVFIARQDISATQVATLAETFTEIITSNGGTVSKHEYWGLRGLAYRIKKNRKGHYSLFNIDAPWTAVQEMERNMRLNEDVLRYLTIRVDELEEGPSVVMQNRGSRDDRRRGEGDRHGRRRPRDDERGERKDEKPAAEAKSETKSETKSEAPAESAAPKDEKPAAKDDSGGDAASAEGDKK